MSATVLDKPRSISCLCSSAKGAVSFDNLDPEHVELERTRILEGEAGVNHMDYRVQGPA